MGQPRRSETNPDRAIGGEARDRTPVMSAAPQLHIYVMSHCENCRYALEMADWIARRYPQVQLRVFDLETTTEPIPESVFATPTYLLNGRVWSLGNPSQDQVIRALEPLRA